MRVIIAGGTGFIGRALAADWASRGNEVLVLSRNAPDEGPARNLGPGVTPVRWEGRGGGDWADYVDGAGLVVNLAGERVAGAGLAYRWTKTRKTLLETSRREAGAALVAAIGAARLKPRVLVQASGIDYYGAGEEAVDETSSAGSSYLSSLVGGIWEPSTAAVEAMGVRRIILRMGPVLGAGSPVLGPLVLQHRLFAGGPLGSGRQWFPWVALEDVLASLRFPVGREEAAGPWNLVSPGIVRNGELSRSLATLLGLPSWLGTPAFALRLAFGEMAETLLTGVHALPRRLLEAGYRFAYPDIGAVLGAALGRTQKP